MYQNAFYVKHLDTLGIAAAAPTAGPAATGTVVTYQGSSYKCLQGHTAQVGWEPPLTPALWQNSEHRIAGPPFPAPP
jgi:hypothetical protein